MKAKKLFEEPLKRALDRFDPQEAQALLDKISDFEETGYALNSVETRLINKLIKCVEGYQKHYHNL